MNRDSNVPQYPDFTSAQRRRLRSLGLEPVQIEELRHALVQIRLALAPTPARNDVVALLDDVQAGAKALSSKMHALAARIDPAHTAADALIQMNCWNLQGEHISPDAPLDYLVPLLEALSDAALAAREELPKTAVRHRVASPQPIGAIEAALRRGWSRVHGSGVFSTRLIDGEEVQFYDGGRKLEKFPDRLNPSAKDSSDFREIVGICYDAEGGNPDPVTAIKKYLSAQKSLREEIRVEMDSALRQANSRQPARKRTSRKR